MANPNPVRPPREKLTGRPKGVPNKVTLDIRTAIKDMFDKTVAPNLDKWITEIHRDHGPERALKAAAVFAEFAVPKLGRTELVGKDGGDINVRIRWQDEDA